MDVAFITRRIVGKSGLSDASITANISPRRIHLMVHAWFW